MDLFPNWVKLENGEVVDSSIYNIDPSLLNKLKYADLLETLKQRNWHTEFIWYDKESGNGLVNFVFKAEVASV